MHGTQQADVVVVGAGYAGLSAAIELAQRGLSVVVLEADRVCSGASGRNGGQAIIGFASGQEPFEQQLGAADARLAWDMSIEAIGLMDERIAQHQIDCERVHGYLYVADSPRKARALEADLKTMQERYGLACDLARAARQVGVRIFEQSPVTALKRGAGLTAITAAASGVAWPDTSATGTPATIPISTANGAARVRLNATSTMIASERIVSMMMKRL